MAKRIRITIAHDGTIQAEVGGIKGKKCAEYIKVIEELLGAKTIDSEYTDEYYEAEEITLQQETMGTHELTASQTTNPRKIV